MAEKPADKTIAGQVELAVGRLDCLSVMPSVAVQFFSKLAAKQYRPTELADIVESDPALTAKTFSLMYQHGLHLAENRFSVRAALEKLPADLVRDCFFSVKIYQPADGDDYRLDLRKELLRHILATADCAKTIAEIISPPIDTELAHSAGLLHNLGMLALEETMPRSFAAIRQQAQAEGLAVAALQQKHLGTDYITVGRRLAQKWHLPKPVTLAIWLHTSDTAAICQSMPEAKIAQVVQLADLLTKQAGFGQPDSYRISKPIEQLAQALGIDGALLGQITQSLPAVVKKKAEILQLDETNAANVYLGIFQKTAGQLAHDNSQLCQENQQFKTDSRHLNFAMAFLRNIDSETLPIDIAEDFAIRWQQFYQTGPVCLYLQPPVDNAVIEAVIVENPSDSKAVLLKAPTEIPALPQPQSGVLDAGEYAGWLLEQLDIELDPDKTKLVPLTSRAKPIGAIVFEFHYPAQAEQICEKFRASTAIAATVLDMALTSETHQHLAEQIVRLLGQKTESNETLTAPVDLPEQNPLEVVTEMAAGAAHELNNPLSVISGRAQLLNKSETDSEKKRMLEQIQKNAAEIAAIIDGLMSFARPAEPRPNLTDVTEILDEARQLATHSIKDAQVDFKIDAENRAIPVFADSAQIVTSIANIFSNAIESYDDKTGPIKVTAQKEGDFVRITITDSGCGMDALTVKKALYPFFSAKPASRKRGNGLALANRLIELNRGKLKIVSQPGIGSKVMILLPCSSSKSEKQL